jgi:hypothetical protein
MKKFLLIVTFSFFLVVGCALSTPWPETAYSPSPGGPQEYRADMNNMANMDSNDMYNYLAPYGNWVNLAPYGYVWTPRNMGYRWRPYSNGHWVSTDDGWAWVSHEEWGSIPFHYGRWGYDNYFGWFWVPGTVWGPAWVSWRWSSQYVGWAPLPPGVEFRAGMGFTSLSFKIPHRFWIFLQAPHFLDRDIDRYTLPYERNATIINFTSLHNNIYFRNNRIINEGIGIDRVRRITGRTVPLYTIRNVRDRNPRQARVEGNDLHIYRPTFRKNAGAKPRTYLDRNEARRKLAPVKVFEPRLKSPLRAQESAVRRRQARQKSLLKKTQSQELKNMKIKRARELAQIRDKAEKKKISQDRRDKMIKLQRQHHAEKQRLTKRIKQDLKQVKQVAKQRAKQEKKKKQEKKQKKQEKKQEQKKQGQHQDKKKK